MEKALNNKDMKDLFEAISSIKTVDECKKFLRDLCTITELSAMAERYKVVKAVVAGESYREISKKTGASTATVTRVAYWLKNGMGGYSLILDRLGFLRHTLSSNRRRVS